MSWRKNLGFEWSLFSGAATAWSGHNAQRLGAALAYYAMFSLAPLLLVLVSISGLVFGQGVARGQIYGQLRAVAGASGAAVIQDLLNGARLHPASGILAGVVGFLILLLGASSAFVELRDDLNLIWDIPPRNEPMWRSIVQPRLFSLVLVLGSGLLMTASLAASVVIVAAEKYMQAYIAIPAFLLETANFAVTFAATAFVFGLIYTVVPDRRIPWSDVMAGSITTAILFAAGKFVVALYLGRAGVGSLYGAAGSLIVFLVWVYYSSQIFLFGAEFTHIYSQRHGLLSREAVNVRVVRTPQ